MKKYILILFFLSNVNLGFSQCEGAPPPPSECDCDGCCELLGQDPDTCEWTVITPAYTDCAELTCPPVPIDSNILILLAFGVSLGIFKLYENKKRQFEK